tara:strand:+ start:212 stop:346 length:135 start_codon:yes stop_codon:yes gene_type:complete
MVKTPKVQIAPILTDTLAIHKGIPLLSMNRVEINPRIRIGMISA